MALTLQQVRDIPAFSDMSDSDIISHASANGFDTSAMIPDPANEAGAFRSYASIPMLKGLGDIGGVVGYGLEAIGLEKAGKYVQDSNTELQKTLTARQSQQAQSDASKTIIDEDGNYGGYNFGTLSQDVFGSLPGTVAMGGAGLPIAQGASIISKAVGLGNKIAKIASSGALGNSLAKGLTAATIDTAIGSSVGFGASEGIYSGASSASQIQTQIRNTDINILAEHPLFADIYHYETNRGLTPEERLQETREILAVKAGDDVFATTAVETGLISMATGGGFYGMIRANSLAKDAAKDGVLKNAAKGFAVEGIAQEGPQSAFEQLTTNQALRDYALPNQDIYQGVANAGIQGGLAGGVMGFMGGGSSPTAVPPSPHIPDPQDTSHIPDAQVPGAQVPDAQVPDSFIDSTAVQIPDTPPKQEAWSHRTQYDDSFDAASKEYGVPVNVLKALAMQESGIHQFDKHGNTVKPSTSNALGIMQIIPRWHPEFDATQLANDADYNIRAGTQYLSKLMRTHGGNVREALKDYYGSGNDTDDNHYADSVIARIDGASTQALPGNHYRLTAEKQVADEATKDPNAFSYSQAANESNEDYFDRVINASFNPTPKDTASIDPPATATLPLFQPVDAPPAATDALVVQLNAAIAKDTSKSPVEHYNDIVSAYALTQQQGDELQDAYRAMQAIPPSPDTIRKDVEQTYEQAEATKENKTGEDQSPRPTLITKKAFDALSREDQDKHLGSRSGEGFGGQFIPGDKVVSKEHGSGIVKAFGGFGEWVVAFESGVEETVDNDTIDPQEAPLDPQEAPKEVQPVLNKNTGKPFKTSAQAKLAIRSRANPEFDPKTHMDAPVGDGYGIVPRTQVAKADKDSAEEYLFGQQPLDDSTQVKQPWEMTHTEFSQHRDGIYESSRLGRLAKVDADIDVISNKGEGYDELIAKEIARVAHTITPEQKFRHNIPSGYREYDSADQFVLGQLLRRRKNTDSTSGMHRISFGADMATHYHAIQKAIDAGETIPQNVLDSLPTNFPELKRLKEPKQLGHEITAQQYVDRESPTSKAANDALRKKHYNEIKDHVSKGGKISREVFDSLDGLRRNNLKNKYGEGFLEETGKASIGASTDGSDTISSLVPNKLKSLVVVVKSQNEIPDLAKSFSTHGVDGYYDPLGDKIYLVSGSLSKKRFAGVLTHELFHRAIATDAKVRDVFLRFKLSMQDRFDLAAKGKATKIENEAYQRVIDAETGAADRLEEFSAYMVEHYVNQAQTTGAIANLISDFIAAIRTWLIRNGFDHGLIKSLTAADLASLAKINNPTQIFKATEADTAEINKYEKENGFRPYSSSGQVEISIETGLTSVKAIDEKKGAFSSKVTEEHPLFRLPMNANGTVTLYFPTTRANAHEVLKTKKLKGDTPESNRIYLTSESNVGAILKNRGAIANNMDAVQEAHVMVHVRPELLNKDYDFEYSESGRQDFYITLAEGQSFTDKMSLMKLFNLRTPRDAAISEDTNFEDIRKAFSESIAEFNALGNGRGSRNSRAQQKALREARKVLSKYHNIGNLLTENGKLAKTRAGDFDLQDYEGLSVASMGLAMASSQKINTKNLSSCLMGAICKNLCLGETSGQNKLYGGVGDYRAGARLSQYLKLEALVLHPKEFALVLSADIKSLEEWSAKDKKSIDNPEYSKNNGEKRKIPTDEIYTPSVRLNISSDIPAKVFEAIIAHHSGVKFYDYTKLNQVSIASNHSLTYSSTGVRQVIDGVDIGSIHNHWASDMKRLNGGQNVAMAFTSKKDLPETVKDAVTGQVFKVWNGDNYDARFLDPKPQDGIGWIIGLTNKDMTSRSYEAAEKNDGFFVHYETNADKQVVVQDQSAIGVSPEKVDGKFSKSPKSITDPHSKTTLSQAITKAMDTLFGQGWANRLMATGKFKLISASEAAGIIGKNAMFHKVWHGSPHDHDKFDSAYIGNGEGQQAYGWGHYFADKKSIAEWYRNKLSNKELSSHSFTKGGRTLRGSDALEEYYKPGRILSMWPRGKEEVVAFHTKDKIWSVTVKTLENQFGKSADSYDANPRTHQTTPSGEAVTKVLSEEGWTVSQGRLYEVDLAPDQDSYLDWEKPISMQSDKVKAILQAEMDKKHSPIGEDNLPEDGRSPFGAGKRLYKHLQWHLFSDEKASEYLSSLGIRGIRYKAEQGQSEANNYVVFNDADVKIEAKYSKNGDVIAFYNPADDTTYLVHDNITQDTSDKALQGLLLHEIGVHALALGKSSEAFQGILRRFEALKKTNPKVQAAFDRVPQDTKAEDIVEEALAYFLESNPKSSIAQRIVEWLRQAVRALGKTLPVLERAKFSQWANKLTEAELIGMATSALKSAPDSLQFDNAGRQTENIKLEKQQLDRKYLNHKEANNEIPELTAAAKQFKAGEISRDDWDAAVDKYKPVSAYTEVPEPASNKHMELALFNKGKNEKVSKLNWAAKHLKSGHLVKLRLDIPAYLKELADYVGGAWVVTVHEGDSKAKALSYQSTAVINNATFKIDNEDYAQDIATYDKSKYPLATMIGELENMSYEEARKEAEAALNDPAWTQVGMDPRRHSYFYNRKTMTPVTGGDRVIQIGGLVLVKNARSEVKDRETGATKYDFKYSKTSNLNAMQQAQVRTEAFKKWFGDWENDPENASKVVDENGEPLVVYHGTDNVRDVFKKGESGALGPGIYTTQRKDHAQSYGDYVQSVYVNTKNPLVIEDTGRLDIAEAIARDEKFEYENFYSRGGASKWARDQLEEHAGIGDPDFNTMLSSAGYDGVIYKKGNVFTEISAQNPNQIKSATENNGDFSQSNNIKFSRATKSKDAMWALFAKAEGKQELSWLAGFFQRNHLIDLAGNDLPDLINYKLLSQAKDNFVNKREDEIGKDYHSMMNKLDIKSLHELGRVQGMATRLDDFDPAEATDSDFKHPDQGVVYAAYKALSTGAKEVYEAMRKAYKDDLEEKKQALIERIKAFPADDETKAKAIKTIEEHFDKFKKGVYFPLNRDGKVIVKAINSDGEIVIEHVKTQAAAYKLVKEMVAQGYGDTHIIGKDAYNRDLLAGNAANDMAALAHRTIKDLKGKSIQGELTAADFDDLFNEFNQLLINTLPDTSYRKHFIHRKGTLGESTDTLRAYAKIRTSAAKMIASLTYDHKIQAVLTDADKAIKKMDQVSGSDTLAIKSIVNELKLREDILKRTDVSPVAQALTSLGFIGALGFNISSAAVNMLQVVGVALPELVGRHGYEPATKAIFAAYKLMFNPAALNRDSGLDVTKNPRLSALTRRAMDELVAMGKIDRTMAHDAIAAGKQPSYSSDPLTRVVGKVSKYAGYFFHVAESANRQITGMAAFHLAYQKNGGDFDAAIAEAVDVIDLTQFDYGQGNRARYMMSDTARVLTLFKAYALGMSYFIGRNAYLYMKGESPEIRQQARRTLVVSMAMSFATAGLFGMPIGVEAFAGIGGVTAFKYKGAKFAVPGAIGGMLVFQSLLAGLGADDEDDVETEFRNWLTDNFDQTVAEFVTKGPARMLPIGDIAGRTSSSDLWWRAQNKQLEGTDQYNAIATALIGPIGSQISGLFTAKKMYEDGQYSRMIEAMSPAALRNAIAANRMSDEGVTNLKGDKIIQRDLTATELIEKAIGFSPTVVSNAYEANSAIAKEGIKHTTAKSHLTNRWISGDAEERRALMAGDIKDFNETVPRSEKITLKSLFKSNRARKGLDKRTKNGLYLSKKQTYLRDIGRFNPQE